MKNSFFDFLNFFSSGKFLLWFLIPEIPPRKIWRHFRNLDLKFQYLSIKAKKVAFRGKIFTVEGFLEKKIVKRLESRCNRVI